MTLTTTKVKAADLKGIRVRNAKSKPVKFDVTTQNAFVQIKSPKTGITALLKIVTQTATARFQPGNSVEGDEIRVAYLFKGTDIDNVTHWRGFALVDEFGVNVFSTCKGNDEPSFFEKLAGMLERPTFFRDKGCEYKITLIV